MKTDTCYCRNAHCQFYGRVGQQARFVFRDWHEGAPRFRCTDCNQLVGARTGTAYAGIRTAESIYQSGARHLAEGTSIRATGRLLSLDKDTVCHWLPQLGTHCNGVMSYFFRSLHVSRAACQLDELWTFIFKKEDQLTPLDKLLGIYGDAWVWIAFSPVCKLVPAWVVGKRTLANARKLVFRLKSASLDANSLELPDRLLYLTFLPIDHILIKNPQAGGIMIRKLVSLSVAVFIGLLFTMSLLASTAQASPAGERQVCASGCPYSTIQAAVDAAANGDVIKIAAGTYTGVSARSGVTQVVYINKALTLQGGYTSSNWTTSDPVANPTTIDAQGQGRVMYITLQNKAVTLDGLRLIGGSTAHSGGGGTVGGGIYALGWNQGSAITLTRNQVLENKAGTYGGGLTFWAITVTLTSNTIASNTVPGGTGNLAQGGGVYLANAIARLTDNTILSNTVPIGIYYGDSGGGVYAQYSVVMSVGNTFANNQAEEGGGLSALRTPLTLSGNTFVSNTAGSGGGGMYYGADTDASAIITLTNNSFVRNSAAGSGGGAWLTPLKGTLTGNVFEHNLAGDGGALLINSLALQDNRIVSNTATYHGGGLYLTSYPTLSRNIITGNVSNKGGGLAITGRGNTNPLLINNIIADNRVTALPGKNGWGSAVYLEDASARLLHTTIARNTGGDGSGLYMTSTLQYYGALALTNTIVVSNPIGLKITSGHTATLNGMLWFNSPVTLTAAAMTTVSVQSQYSDDPKFALDGYHILSGSAAIDHGVNAGVTTDIDNQLRPNGLAPDLGADEWNPPLDKHVYLPLVIK